MKKRWLIAMMLCGVSLGYFIYASDVNARQNVNTPQSQQDTREKVFLSLDEAISLVLQNNLDINIEQYNPEIKKQEITSAESAFDMNVGASGAEVYTEPSSAQSPQSVTNIQTGIDQRIKTGGQYNIQLKTSRMGFGDAEVGGQKIGSSYDTNLSLTLNQALLKNRGVGINTTPIAVARKSREMSLSDLKSKVIQVVSDVKTAYWELIYAIGDLEAKRLSLQLAYDLVKINEAQVNVGTLAPIEVLQAKTTAAGREVEVISAERTVQDDEDKLKRLLNVSETDQIWNASIVPTDAPGASQQSVSLEESIRLALQNREELFKLKKGMEIQELGLIAAENQMLPELNLQGVFEVDGNKEQWSDSVTEVFKFNDYSFTLGAQLALPIGNRKAKSAYSKTKLEIEQSRLSLKNLEQLVTIQIKQAVRGVETSYKLVEASKIAQQLAAEQLDAEQKKFNEGLSTNFQVLTYQNQLASSKSQYTQAITNYNKALVALDQLTGVTLQRHNIIIKE